MGRRECPTLLAARLIPARVLLTVALAWVVLAPILIAIAPAPARAAFIYEYIDARQVKIIPPFETIQYLTRLTNTGAAATQYTCTVQRHLPAEWLSSLCSEGACVIDSLDVLLQPAEEETLLVDVFAFGVAGSGTMDIHVRESANPGTTQTLSVGALSGVDHVVIDDDGGAAYETYAREALDGLALAAGVWPYWIEPPELADLETFAAVYWLTGDDSSQTLSAVDRALLAAYLDGGGRLLASGQGIGAELDGTPFYADYLGATLLADDAGSTQVEGVAGDPIGDGLAFAISGGDGASNQTSPDAVAATGAGSSPVLAYANQLGAGVRVEGGGLFRTVYLGFGFEGVATAADRLLLMQRIAAWLVAPPGVGVGEPAAAAPAAAAARPLAVPNPVAAGAGATLRFALPGGGGAGPGGGGGGVPQVVIYDAAGRWVARVAARRRGAALFEARWDGTAPQGGRVPPGVYFFRLAFFRIEASAGSPAAAHLVEAAAAAPAVLSGKLVVSP